MKITVNGKISEDALKIILDTQKKKTIIIDDYCKKEKLRVTFLLKTQSLNNEYQKQAKPKPKKVETRKDDKGN